MKISETILKRILLLIWALWAMFVTLSNVCDGLKAIGIFPDSFKFVSGNFGYIQAATQIYNFPVWLNAVLFILVILWEGIISFLFFKAFFNYNSNNNSQFVLPFLFAIILFGGFLIMDEILIVYDRLGSIEQSHFGFLIGFVVSYLLVRNIRLES